MTHRNDRHGYASARRTGSSSVLFWALVFALTLAPFAGAEEYYVDNVKGNDENPGTLEKPFRTFQKSLSAIAGGDTLHLVPNAEPYREKFGELSKKHSGTPQKPTIVDGHGAQITRLNHFPAERWKSEGDDVYSLRFRHNIVVMSGKGYYDGFPFAFIDDKPASCVKSRGELTPNSCFLFLLFDKEKKALHTDHGMLYIKLEPGKTPADVTIMLPEPDDIAVGGDYITVKNFNAKWSSADLFDTHRGTGIVFENIVAENCLDQCVSAHSTAGCEVRYSFFRNALAMCVLDITFTPKEDYRMTYNGCIFEQGGAGFQGAGHYTVENSIFRDSARNALMARADATLTVRNSIMVKGKDGLYGLGISDNANVTLENCTFIGFKWGISIQGANARLTLKNCVFLDCKEIYFFFAGAMPEQIVAENTIFSPSPVFNVNQRIVSGLDRYRNEFNATETDSRELAGGERTTSGSSLPADLTLQELTSRLQAGR